MPSGEVRKIVLQPSETIFGRICLERGWATRAQIADCLRSRGAEGSAPLPDLLVSRGLISREQSETLQSEVAQVAQTGLYADVRESDASLGKLLVDSGTARAEHVERALKVQEEWASKGGPFPRLGQILLEEGHVTLAALQKVLYHQEALTRLACTGCGARYVVEGVEAGKTYLCERCASPLSASLSGTFAAADLPEPEEARRSATNPKNVVGKYVVVRELGHGSMGAVYKAWDTEVRRWVALKVLVAVGNRELLIRFRREAETAAALQHPGIVPIYDVGEAGGLPYIAMRHIEGETLKGKTLSVRRACEVVSQAARAVGHAHRREIVHRDLKPGNLMADSTGRVYVMDFGLAKDLFGASQLTAPGTVLGTPSYMAPEQAAGKIQQVDQRSDVYSLGAILYEFLTGRAPFRGDRLVDTIRQVLHDPVVPPRRLRSEVPEELEAIVLRALEKEKARRFESADALAEALERHLAAEPEEARSASGWAWVLAALVAAGLGVLGYVLFR